MSCGEMEVGRCKCCGKENVPLNRKYFYYPGIKHCECHSPEHFICIEHCKDCAPKEPEYSKVEFKTDSLKHPEQIASDILKELFSENSYDIEKRDSLKADMCNKINEYIIDDKHTEELVENIINIFISMR